MAGEEEAAASSETTTKKKGPSKKELKKLAKKAEKAAAKKNAAKGGGGGGGGSGAAAPSDAEGGGGASQTPKPTAYYLANASPSDPASLKASVASALHSVPIHRAPTTTSRDSFPFAHGPVLTTDPTGRNGAIAFGGNAIAKALGLLGGATYDVARADEWLEFERSTLRPALSSLPRDDDEKKKKKKAALSRVEDALSSSGGMHLVGGRTTAADVSIVVALHELSDVASLPDVVGKYVLGHVRSPAFRKGYAALPSLVPPPPFRHGTDPSLLKAVESVFEVAIVAAFPQSAALDVSTSVQRCSKPKLADFQCNASMVLFKKLKDSGGLPSEVRTPQDVARSLVASVPEDNPVMDGLEVNGPGFVLCKIKPTYLQTLANDLSSSGEPKKPFNLRPTKCVVDFSSPNIAKEMHVGHLRSTIIGESVCRILEYGGCDVERVNHVGDWGTQFGMLIQYLREEYPDFEEGGEGEAVGGNITDLTAFYKSAKERFDESPEFKKSAQSNVVSLQSGDPSCLRMWKALCDVSRREFQKVYDRLDVSVSECGESFYNDKMPAVIEEFEKANMISVEEGGAKCVFVEGFRVPLMLQKSDGGFGYDSTDMAAIKHRLRVLEAKRVVVITDFGQGDHFKMCNAAADAVGWVDPSVHRLEHIGFGTVQGEDGKRFKTRSGDTVRLVDLLDEAVERMERSLTERIEEGKANITEDEVHETACALGYGAVKYFDLRRNPTTNYVFSYDRMLDTRGNTAIYLLYAHARLTSICTKGKSDHGVDADALAKSGDAEIVLGHPSERNLALHLALFADAIETTLEDLYPYHVCEFLYNASIAASDFVTQCKVLGSPEMESRLLLCRAAAIVMRRCFDLLGIRHVMRI